MSDTENRNTVRIGCASKALWAVACVFLLGLFLASMLLVRADISGSSMEPGLSDGDVCIAVKAWGRAGFGDVVLVDDPGGGRVLVKRVIGLPGDEIEVDAEGRVTRNGDALDEPYAAYGEGSYGAGSWTVPEGQAFLLGDNRGSSQDSRSSLVGMVPLGSILGRVVLRLQHRGTEGGSGHAG